MSSLLKISNKALRKIGIKEIESLDAQGEAPRRCKAAVEDVIREVLAVHAWSHATEWATLSPLADAPPFGYEYSYQLPVECERVIDVRADTDLKAPRINFELVRGRKIYTDATPCYVRYVLFDVRDLPRANSLFIDACAWKLAAEIAIPLGKTESLGKMLQGYQLAVEIAKLADAVQSNERQQDENRLNTILSARGYPGVIGDGLEDESWP